MMEKLHTPEPWGISPDVSTHIWNEGGDTQIAACNLDNANSIANARRIVACVNALEGVATDRLETANISGSGFWGKCIHDADVKYSELAIQNKELTAQRDELLAALTHAATDYIDQNGSVPSWWTEKIRQMVKDGKK
jgi:hypothetical protein